LDQIPDPLIEAAKVDGAKEWNVKVNLVRFERSSPHFARALLADLFIRYFSKDMPVLAPDEMPEWLNDLLRTMNKKDHFTAGLMKLHELSPKSPEHLSRMFKRYVGMTPTQWINNVRLQYAANLLAMTDEAVLSVCYECGFENLSHFNHQFKRTFALSPSRYRKENQKLVIPG
jgi:AraC family cel operon transcriptional repressor